MQPATPGGRTRPWFGTLFWRILLGLLGGLIAWGIGEIPRRWSQTPLAAFTAYSIDAEKIRKDIRGGDLTAVQGVEAMNRLNRANANNPYVRIVNNTSYPPREKSYRLAQLRYRDAWKARIGPLAWYCTVGVILAMFLSAAECVAVRNARRAIVQAAIGSLLGLVGGFLVCLLLAEPYRAIPGVPAEGANLVVLILAQSAGWAILGMFLAIAPGVLPWSGKRVRIGLASGLIGGLAGGLLFEPVYLATGNDIVCRLVALVIVGLAMGLGTSLIENAARTAWLRAVAGPLAGRQFILYRDPTCIGSSPKGEICLLENPPIASQHAAIRAVEGGYDIEDLHMGCGTFVNGSPIDRTRLNSGDRVQIGSTCFVFQEKGRAKVP